MLSPLWIAALRHADRMSPATKYKPTPATEDVLPDGTSMKQFKFSTGTSADEKKLQIEKFSSTVDDLLKAGYFRAGITKLSLFDRVIGGLCWSITSSGVAVDADILFRENMDIGQKVVLSEQVVDACRQMKCPYPLQANQISQCNDFGALLPVIQWLCDAVIQWRALTGDTTRLYSEMEFNHRGYTMPEESYELNSEYLESVQNRYTPNRMYKINQASWSNSREEEEARVQSCLLEYGEKFKRKKRSQDDEEKLNMITRASAGDKGSKGGGRLAGFEKEYARMQRIAEKEEEERAKSMESREKELLQQMSQVKGSNAKGAGIRASEIAGIVRQQSDMIKAAAADLERVEQEIQSKVEGGEGGGAVSAKGLEQQHQRMVDGLQKKIDKASKKLTDVKTAEEESQSVYTAAEEKYQARAAYRKKISAEMSKVEAVEGKAEYQQLLAKLRELIQANEALKVKETSFKASCKQQREDIQKGLTDFKSQTGNSEDSKRLDEIDHMFNGVQEKYNKICQLLAKKKQKISMVGRSIDDVPTRTELIQYEKRFVELYQQVQSKLEDNRKYYDYYNTQQRVLTFLSKEADLLQSINDTFLPSMKTKAGKEAFLSQLEGIIGGVQTTKTSQETVLGKIKAKHSAAAKAHEKLVEKQRAYFKAVKDFQDACDKNELLEDQLAELKGE